MAGGGWDSFDFSLGGAICIMRTLFDEIPSVVRGRSMERWLW